VSKKGVLCHPALDVGSRDSAAYEIFGDGEILGTLGRGFPRTRE